MAATQRSAPPQPRRRVLVVEDNLDAVHSMAMLIHMLGHECQFAINGFAALDIARAFRPEVVLLDIGLPDFTGYDIVRLLRRLPEFQSTRFIAISALPDQYGEAALEAGCEAYFRKPVDPRVLEEMLGRP